MWCLWSGCWVGLLPLSCGTVLELLSPPLDGRRCGGRILRPMCCRVSPSIVWAVSTLWRWEMWNGLPTSAAFLDQLRKRHFGPLQVIWDNAPAHRGEAVREYLRRPGLGLRLVNPRFHEGRLCRATAQTSTPMKPFGAGRGKRRPGTCAWEAERRCKRGWAASWLG